MKGLHIIADLYNCAKGDFLLSSAKLRELCVNACKNAGLTVLGDHFIQFDGADGTQQGGSTGAVVLAESHLAIHTFPESGTATLNAYCCRPRAPAPWRALLGELLGARDVIATEHPRGRA